MEVTKRFSSVSQYISAQPKETRVRLQELRTIIRKYAPEAEEVISYNMPSLKQEGRLLYYAGYKNHVGFYPLASGVAAFKSKIGRYKYAKGSIQFPVDQPFPVKLISEIVKYRVKENLEKAALMGKKRK